MTITERPVNQAGITGKINRIFWFYYAIASNMFYKLFKDSYYIKFLGCNFYLNIKDAGLSQVLKREGIREIESTISMLKYLRPDMKIIDIGSNIGYYVIIECMVVKNGNGRIIAIEPGQENVKILQKNIASNGFSQIVTVIEGAVADSSGDGELILSDSANCHTLREPRLYSDSDKKIIQVRKYSIEDILRQCGIQPNAIDFIRMDIEGYEYLLLPTMYPIFDDPHELYMFIEFHPHINPDLHKKVLSDLEKRGFYCIDATKEYMHNRSVRRKYFPKATLKELYTTQFFTQDGGLETFLYKPGKKMLQNTYE
jgi:FkbM family methyltransferase